MVSGFSFFLSFFLSYLRTPGPLTLAEAKAWRSEAQVAPVPIPAVLRDDLVEHKLRSRHHIGLVFGTSYAQPFTPSNVRTRANAAWARADLEPIGLHECLRTFASLVIAAGSTRRR
jgi:hypothetical protein